MRNWPQHNPATATSIDMVIAGSRRTILAAARQKADRDYGRLLGAHRLHAGGVEVVRLTGGSTAVLLVDVVRAVTVATMSTEVTRPGFPLRAVVASLCFVVEVAPIVVVVRADVAGQLRSFAFIVIGFDDRLLHHFTARAVDGMSDVGVQLGPTFVVAGSTVFVHVRTAIVAIAGPQVILAATTMTTIGQLARGHRHEEAFRSFDDLQIPNDKSVIERDRTESHQALVVLFN